MLVLCLVYKDFKNNQKHSMKQTYKIKFEWADINYDM